jgi:hypothetical protein
MQGIRGRSLVNAPTGVAFLIINNKLLIISQDLKIDKRDYSWI